MDYQRFQSFSTNFPLQIWASTASNWKTRQPKNNFSSTGNFRPEKVYNSRRDAGDNDDAWLHAERRWQLCDCGTNWNSRLDWSHRSTFHAVQPDIYQENDSADARRCTGTTERSALDQHAAWLRTSLQHFHRVHEREKSFAGKKKKTLSAVKSLTTFFFQLFVHSDLESLYKHVPKRLLPKEYGGEAGTVESVINEWEKRMMSYRNYYIEEDSLYGVDEKKRVGQKKSSDVLFGVDGTFRQLSID